MGRRFVWQLVDDSARPLAGLGEALEYVEQRPRPGDLALIELYPTGVAAVAELVSSSREGLVVRDLGSGARRVIPDRLVQRASRIVGRRTRSGTFVSFGGRWPT